MFAAELAGALFDTEMNPDEFIRRESLGLVCGGSERGKMRIVCHNKMSLRRNGAVAKFVVIGVLCDDRISELRFDLPDVAVKAVKQFQQRDDFPPAFRAGKFRRDFLVLEQDFVGHRQRQPAVQQRAKDWIIRLPPAEDLKKDVGVEADRHA